MTKILSNKIVKAVLFLTLVLSVFAVNKNVAEAAASGYITATTVVTGKEEGKDSVAEGVISADPSGTTRSSVIAVTTDCSGLLDIAYRGTNTEDVTVRLFSDEACTSQIGYSSYVSPSAEATYVYDLMTVPKKGTYYIQFSSYEAVDIEYVVAAAVYSSDDRNLKSGVQNFVALTDSEDANFYKITTSKAGVVDVFASYADGSDSSAKVAIYKNVSGKKKLVASKSSSSDGSAFALAKGTYYIKLYNGGNALYAIKYKFSAVTDNSGASKAKAAKLTYGKEKKGLILSTDKTSKADWYKFYNAKKRKVTIYFDGDVTGGVTLDFYGSDGSKFGSLNLSEYTSSTSASPYVGSVYSNSGQLPKGNYYIKVTKDSKDVSGYYTIKMK